MEYQAFHNTPWLHGSFWVFIAIVIFALLAGRKIATVLTTMLDGRTAAITAALQEAAALKARQAQALRDAASIVANAHAEAERMAAALAAEAAATATRRERMAQERIAAAEAQALADIRATAIDVAAAASRALLQGGFGAEGDVARIDDAIAALPEALRKQVSSAF
jgi:F-type H+-transporting ATPase subunit b